MLHANVLPVNRNGHGRLAAVTDRLAKTVFDCVRFNNLTNSLAAQVTTAPATTGKIGLAHLSPFASSAMIASIGDHWNFMREVIRRGTKVVQCTY